MARSVLILFALVACSSSSENNSSPPGDAGSDASGGKAGLAGASTGGSGGSTGGSGGSTGGSGGSTGGSAGASGAAGSAPTLQCHPDVSFDPVEKSLTYCPDSAVGLECVYFDVNCSNGASFGGEGVSANQCWTFGTSSCGEGAVVSVLVTDLGTGCNGTPAQLATCPW